MQVLEALWQRQMRHLASMCAQQLPVTRGFQSQPSTAPISCPDLVFICRVMTPCLAQLSAHAFQAHWKTQDWPTLSSIGRPWQSQPGTKRAALLFSS